MKGQIHQKKKQFQPVEVSIKLKSIFDVKVFLSMMNVSNANLQKAGENTNFEISSKDISLAGKKVLELWIEISPKLEVIISENE